jgi:hypothetical protein
MLEIHFARIEASPTGGDNLTIIPLTPTYRILEYVPKPAPLNITLTPGRRVGARPVASIVDNVTEPLTLRVKNDVYQAQHLLNQAFQMALEWSKQFRRDMRFVVRIRDPQRHQQWFEAELYNGRAEMDNSSGHVLRVTWDRAPYWQGAEQILQLSNTVASGYTLSIYNHDDYRYGHDDFVIVNAPEGDVPTPARIRIRNTYDRNRLRQVRIGWYDRPHYLTLEGENSELNPSNAWNADFSNEQAGTAARFQWTLNQSNVVDYVGMFRVLANGSLSDSTWQISAGYELTALQTAAVVAGSNGWTDLGLISLPPGGYVHPFRYPMRIWLTGSTARQLDYVRFIPVDQFRRITFKGYNCVPGACIVDDGIRDELVYDFNGQSLPVLDGWGDPIEIWPNAILPGTQQQILVFALEDEFGGAHPQRTADIQVTVRPRYNVLP